MLVTGDALLLEGVGHAVTQRAAVLPPELQLLIVGQPGHSCLPRHGNWAARVLDVLGILLQRGRQIIEASVTFFGPNSTNLAQIWPCACVLDPNCSEPSREGRESASGTVPFLAFHGFTLGNPRIQNL